MSTTAQTIAFTLSQAPSKDLSKQVSQDNIAAFLVERVAKYLACLQSIGSQLCYIAEGLNLFLTPAPSPFNQINDINVCPSCSLSSAST